MCCIPKAESEPVTREDMKIKPDPAALPVNLVMDGKVMKENLTLCKIDIAFLGKILKRAGIAQVKKVLILTLDNNGKVFIQEKGQQYQTFSVKFNGGESW